MKPEEKERLAEELLEYLYECHPDPQELEVRLANDAELRALLVDARGEKELLDRAARGPEIELQLPDVAMGTAPPVVSKWRRLRVAAVILPFLALAGAGINMSWHARGVNNAYGESLRLVVSGPSGFPGGVAPVLAVETFDYIGHPMEARVQWTAFDGEGAEIAAGESPTEGVLSLVLPADLAGVRRVDIVAYRGTSERATSFELSPTEDTPLAHLTTDKQAYRPGEVVRFRATLLDRLSLDAYGGRARLRVVDPKGAPIESWVAELDSGVTAGEWSIPENIAGGEFALELRDGTDGFTAERVSFLVRAYQPPQLAKEIELDRKTYAPGESGKAVVRVERMEGGFAIGARLDASLLLDGETVWSATRSADVFGTARFAFEVPSTVARGEARFVCRVTDGGIVETAIEPFVVPTGALEVSFHPEGGDLVAGMRGRVYAEVTDSLGRPVSARGRIVDAAGRPVARFDTEHQGRGRFELEPVLDGSYELRFEEPKAPAVPLPEVQPSGVALRAIGEGYGVGEPLGFRVTTPDAGPWVVAVFCRGLLVGQRTFQGSGEHRVEVEIPDRVAGVLRATIFDRGLLPVAERLVQRASGRKIAVDVQAAHDVLLPGGTQELVVRATDEEGRPVAALLGLSVTDRAVADYVGEARVGLADQAWLFGDVEELEEIEEFIGMGSARNVDLLLGTRGWRRFGWFESDALIAEHGEAAKRVLLREGHSDVPRVRSTQSTGTVVIAVAEQAKREAGQLAAVIASGSLLLAILASIVWWGRRAVVAGPRWPLAVGGALAGGCVFLFAYLSSEAWNDHGSIIRSRIDPMAVAARGGEDIELAFGLEPDFVQEDPNMAAFDLKKNFFLFRAERAGRAAGDEVQNEVKTVAAPKILVQEALLELRALGYMGDDNDWAPRERQMPSPFQLVRVYAHRNTRVPNTPRTDFTETVYWNPTLRLAADGRARVRFDVSDRVTTWNVVIDAHGGGRVGQALSSFVAVQPFRMQAKLPIELTAGDRVQIPIALVSGSPRIEGASWKVSADSLFTLGTTGGEVELDAGRGRVLVPLSVPDGVGTRDGLKLAFSGVARGWKDAVERELRVVPRGFPQHISRGGRVDGIAEFTIGVPSLPVAGSLSARLVLYPSPLADLLEGLDGILRSPSGCFEQASSANYPNVLVLAYLEAAAADEPAAVARARELMQQGYAKIAGYECSEKGYEWFGGNPGHEALTAYGLLEFHDMARVFDVDGDMVERTRQWLLGRRDGKGGYAKNERALDTFGRAPQEVTDAYCTFALAITAKGAGGLEAELDQLERAGLESEDAYVVALAAAGLHASGRLEAADAARERLKSMQGEDGGLMGTTTSITSSGGDDLAVETTSLAMLAWLDDPADAAYVEEAVQFVLSKRREGGTFGATQATIQALRALVAYAEANRRIAQAGEVIVRVDDYEVARIAFDAGQRGAIELTELAADLGPGSRRVQIEVTGGNVFPWAFDLEYFAETPASDPEAAIEIETRLAATEVEEGRTVALEVRVRNRTDAGQPMTLAVVGLPAGLEAPTAVLEDLRKAGRFDLWEIRGRELVFYWRDFAPRAEKVVSVDLIARIPGTTTGPASRCYLYYTSGAKHWAEPLAVRVNPVR